MRVSDLRGAKNQGVCGEFGWAGFLVVCFRYKINPNPRKNICCDQKWPKNATFDLFFLGLGLALGWGVRRFRNNIYMISTQHNFVNRQHPIVASFRSSHGRPGVRAHTYEYALKVAGKRHPFLA